MFSSTEFSMASFHYTTTYIKINDICITPESCHQIPFQSIPPAPAALVPAQRRTLPRGRP